ncbi:hypothetical protein BDN72DRAFT_903592 [Pluteus cervinus]|uniref:Uncharacterized protein n=1 Tax=Pluteus cervinus TaxID=181527 RepID=A0ACD3AAZ3_9AGAR|nr:hypothetical protein BDN72DRAFT_903592 [Pluteus cervinus]
MKTRSSTAQENGTAPQPLNTASGSSSTRRRSRTPNTAPKVAKDKVTSRKPGQPTPRRLKRAASAPNVRGGNSGGSADNSSHIFAIMEVDELPGDDAAKTEADGNPKDGVSISLKDGESDGGEANSDAATNVFATSVTPVPHPTSQHDLGTAPMRTLAKNPKQLNVNAQIALEIQASPPVTPMVVNTTIRAQGVASGIVGSTAKVDEDDQHVMNYPDSKDSFTKTLDAPIDQSSVTGGDALAKPSRMAGCSPSTSSKDTRPVRLRPQDRLNLNSKVKSLPMERESFPQSKSPIPTPTDQSSISDDKNRPCTKRVAILLQQEESRTPRMAWRGYSPRSVQTNIRLWREVSSKPDAELLEKYVTALQIDNFEPQWAMPRRNSTNHGELGAVPDPPESVYQWLAEWFANHTLKLEMSSRTHPPDQTPTGSLTEALGAETSVGTVHEISLPPPPSLSLLHSLPPPFPRQSPDLSPGSSPASQHRVPSPRLEQCTGLRSMTGALNAAHCESEEAMGPAGTDSDVEGLSQAIASREEAMGPAGTDSDVESLSQAIASQKEPDCADSCGLPQDGNLNDTLAESEGKNCTLPLHPLLSTDGAPLSKTSVPQLLLPELLHCTSSSLGLAPRVYVGTHASDNPVADTITTNTPTSSDHGPVHSATEVPTPPRFIPEISPGCPRPTFEVPPGLPQTAPKPSHVLVEEGIAPPNFTSFGAGGAIPASRATVPPSFIPKFTSRTALESEGTKVPAGLIAKASDKDTMTSPSLGIVCKNIDVLLPVTPNLSSSTFQLPPRPRLHLSPRAKPDPLHDPPTENGEKDDNAPPDPDPQDVVLSPKASVSPPPHEVPPGVLSLSRSGSPPGFNPRAASSSMFSISPSPTDQNMRHMLPSSRYGSLDFSTHSPTSSSRASISPPPTDENSHHMPPLSRYRYPPGSSPPSATSSLRFSTSPPLTDLVLLHHLGSPLHHIPPTKAHVMCCLR